MTRTESARHNGRRSKGPITDQGKSTSSRNAVQHGLTSNKMFVLQNESPQAWAEMLAACFETFKPATILETKLVEEIAFAKWRLRRLWFVETSLLDHEMDRQAEAFAETQGSRETDEPLRQALAFKALADDSKALALIARYETRLQRAYDRAVAQLKALRAERQIEIEEQPNEPKAVGTIHPSDVNKTEGSSVSNDNFVDVDIHRGDSAKRRQPHLLPGEKVNSQSLDLRSGHLLDSLHHLVDAVESAEE